MTRDCGHTVQRLRTYSTGDDQRLRTYSTGDDQRLRTYSTGDDQRLRTQYSAHSQHRDCGVTEMISHCAAR
ncbi:unnamed protein product, partial [Staurois parvus]